MATKKSTPAPIDRPLSRAYLREFAGWSTAYAPGLSDPTTLSTMENCYVTREGALAVRPALRSVFAANNWVTTNLNARIIGSFETFFLNNGTKALLFAIREAGGFVSFRVAVEGASSYEIITLAAAGFAGDESAMRFTGDTKYVRYLQIDNKVLALPDSTNPNDTVRIFYVGATKKLVRPRAITRPAWSAADAPLAILPDAAWINGAQNTQPTAETNTTTTLISSTAASNTYNLGYYITFENELGESSPSQMTVIKVQRPWSQWVFQTAAAAGGPSGTVTSDAKKAADQIVVYLPAGMLQAAKDLGATAWNLYMVTWSDQGNVPVEGTLIATRDMTEAGYSLATHNWLQHTPVAANYDITAPLPTADSENYSTPSSAAQGYVAGDRVILVNDRQNSARIRWSSNQLGEYANFSSTKGGGFKTLTAGNLLVPAAVKLWQNPQSVDTLVVLCRGVDGYSTSYYMAPASVNGQTGSTSVMGFEETTATPGTVSPWGVEVVNQGLYHPLDEQLMKSTAANYNISHKTMTDQISNKWLELLDKQNIVSASMDNRLYYIVHNPDGLALESGCMGNEIWVLDVAGPNPIWNRWLIQANSLHKLEVRGKLYMAVVRPDAIFILDDLEVEDQYSNSGETSTRAIPWRMEMNTQGANRAHDAWAHVQQVNITLGNFMGRMQYGIRGLDQHGKQIEISKITKDVQLTDMHTRPSPWDIEDFLLVRRDLKEWRLFAGSVSDDSGVRPSYGQINLVQYRYTPVSVNIGYEFGSVETFEYGRAAAPSDPVATLYPNGVPSPYVDLSH